MTSIEHYFENLLYHGKDVKGDPNKNALSEEEINAVEECASYILSCHEELFRETKVRNR